MKLEIAAILDSNMATTVVSNNNNNNNIAFKVCHLSSYLFRGAEGYIQEGGGGELIEIRREQMCFKTRLE